MQRAHFRDPRQGRQDGLDGGDIRRREAAGAPRGPGRAMDGAVGEEQRGGEIIRHPLGAELGEDREIHGALRIGEMPAERLPRVIDPGDGALEIFRGEGEIGRRQIGPDLRPRLPDEAPPHQLGMQGAHEDADPGQRQPPFDQPPAELAQNCAGIHGRSRAVDQPAGHRPRLGLIHCRFLCINRLAV